MNELEKARLKINEIDDAMRSLFEERMQSVETVFTYKKEHNLDIFDASREHQVIHKNLKQLNNKTLEPYYLSYLNHLMNLSKQYQHHLNKTKGFSNKKSIMILCTFDQKQSTYSLITFLNALAESDIEFKRIEAIIQNKNNIKQYQITFDSSYQNEDLVKILNQHTIKYEILHTQ